MNIKEMKDNMDDYLISTVHRYIQGELIHKSRSTRREREDISWSKEVIL